MAKLGMPDGIKGFPEKWKILRTHQKVEALAWIGATASVALGTFMMIEDRWRSKIKEHEESNSQER